MINIILTVWKIFTALTFAGMCLWLTILLVCVIVGIIEIWRDNHK